MPDTPPTDPKHLLLAYLEYCEHHIALLQDLKLHCYSQLNLDTILYTPTRTKALSTFISAMQVVTAKWVYTKLSRHPAERDIPISLMIGLGTLLEHRDKHGIHED
jgi:hypothetical protein